MTDAAKIARGLTKAQRDVARILSQIPTNIGNRSCAGLSLCLLGLAKRTVPHLPVYHLTQLGLAVRAELERIADE